MIDINEWIFSLNIDKKNFGSTNLLIKTKKDAMKRVERKTKSKLSKLFLRDVSTRIQ